MRGRRYVAYYRVSTRAQGRSGLGLEGQHMAVRDFLAANPGEMFAEVTEVESGYSAASSLNRIENSRLFLEPWRSSKNRRRPQKAEYQ